MLCQHKINVAAIAVLAYVCAEHGVAMSFAN